MKKFLNVILFLILFLSSVFFNTKTVHAASYDPTILAPVSVTLESSGTVTWQLAFGADVTDYKSFQVQL